MIEPTEAIEPDLPVSVLTWALNATPIVVEVASLDGCLAFVSDAWCNLFGHERREVINMAWFDQPPLGTCHDLLESWRLCVSAGHSASGAVVHPGAGRDLPLSLTRRANVRAAGPRDMVVTIYAGGPAHPRKTRLRVTGHGPPRLTTLGGWATTCATTSPSCGPTPCCWIER